MELTNTKRTTRLDRYGMIASCACALHCALVPILLGVVPLVGVSWLGDERIELIMIGVALVIGVGALLPAYLRHHRRKLPLLTFTAGLMLVGIAHTAAEGRSLQHTALVVLGGLLLAAAHFLNRRLCHVCCARH